MEDGSNFFWVGMVDAQIEIIESVGTVPVRKQGTADNDQGIFLPIAESMQAVRNRSEIAT